MSLFPEARTHLRITGATVLAVLGLVLVLELAGRLIIHIEHGVPGKSYGIYQHDPVLGARLRPDSYNRYKQMNNLAMQSAETVPIARQEGVPRIVVYGGSTVYCFNLKTGDDWPSLLQSKLRARGFAGAQVLNAGDVEWSLAHAYQRALGELEALKPDIVLFYSGINEVRNDSRLSLEGRDLAAEFVEGRVGIFDRATLQNSFLFRNSVVYKAWVHWLYKPHVLPLLRKTVRFMTGEPARRQNRPPPKSRHDLVASHYVKTLEAFLGLVRKAGAVPVFIIQAADPNFKAATYRAGFSRAAAPVAAKLGAVILDARELTASETSPGQGLFIETGYHFSALGSKRMADWLANAVDWSRLLSNPAR